MVYIVGQMALMDLLHVKIDSTFVLSLVNPQNPFHHPLAPASLSFLRTLGAAAYLACKIKASRIASTHIESITSMNFYKIFIFLKGPSPVFIVVTFH